MAHNTTPTTTEAFQRCTAYELFGAYMEDVHTVIPKLKLEDFFPIAPDQKVIRYGIAIFQFIEVIGRMKRATQADPTHLIFGLMFGQDIFEKIAKRDAELMAQLKQHFCSLLSADFSKQVHALFETYQALRDTCSTPDQYDDAIGPLVGKLCRVALQQGLMNVVIKNHTTREDCMRAVQEYVLENGLSNVVDLGFYELGNDGEIQLQAQPITLH
jgi:hypothetical protein